jgi:hypothetical protein
MGRTPHGDRVIAAASWSLPPGATIPVALLAAGPLRPSFPMKFAVMVLLFISAAPGLLAERINQEGRILGPEPVVAGPILFNTPAADAIITALQIMPLDSPWNEDVSGRPLLANSDAMIAQIRTDLSASRRTLRAFHEMNFVLVPDTQPGVPIAFVDYPDESDPSPYPIPANMPIETWPRETGALTLQQWQQDVNGAGGDRHSIVVMPGTGSFWETWQALLVGTAWQASNGARFSLRSNVLRPSGWTSGDAAGLPLFPALVRYDECRRGMVEHALRLVVKRTRQQYLYPANHLASSTPASQVNVPAMGQRVRLKAGFAIPSSWTLYEQAVCLGLKKYGAIVADNGGFFSISVTPDDRYPAGAFDNLAGIDVNNFEVVQTTGPDEGPRSPGAPAANAGADFDLPFPAATTVGGSATGTGITAGWTKYAGPGAVTFGDATQATTTVAFGMPGTYTLMLQVRDGVHAVARDAVVVNVVLPVLVVRAGDDATIGFKSAIGQIYSVERATDPINGPWTTIAGNLAGTGSGISVADPGGLVGAPAAVYRVQFTPR